METLAYLHLALTYEEPLERNGKVLVPGKWFLGSAKGRTLLKRGHYCLLALGTAIGLLATAPNAFALLQQGDQSSQVTRVQKRLQELNFFKEKPTGYFGEVTVEAVKEFQRDRGIVPDGIVGSETEAALFSETGRASQADDPFNSESFLSGEAQAPSLSRQNSAANEKLKPIPSVAREDSFLSETLEPAPKANGNLSQSSDRAPESAIAEDQTPASNEDESSAQAELLTVGARGETVKQLQEKLKDTGFTPGAIDGIYGQQTRKAVIAFQRSRGLFVDGIAGQQTLSALNPGSSAPSQRLYSVKVRNS